MDLDRTVYGPPATGQKCEVVESQVVPPLKLHWIVSEPLAVESIQSDVIDALTGAFGAMVAGDAGEILQAPPKGAVFGPTCTEPQLTGAETAPSESVARFLTE